MEAENKKNVVSDEFKEQVKDQEIKVEQEEVSENELNSVSGGMVIKINGKNYHHQRAGF
jgi:bacteriocin-like protein